MLKEINVETDKLQLSRYMNEYTFFNIIVSTKLHENRTSKHCSI